MKAQATVETLMILNFSMGRLSQLLLAVVGTSTVLIGSSQLVQAQTIPRGAAVGVQTAIIDSDRPTQRGVAAVVPRGGVVPNVVVVPSASIPPGVGAAAVSNVRGAAPRGREIDIRDARARDVAPRGREIEVPDARDVAPRGRDIDVRDVEDVDRRGVSGVSTALPR
ncbi:MAG: hypothetical protein AAF773_02935 [Cyanobacteria bacterium P01_D01_bin.115]